MRIRNGDVTELLQSLDKNLTDEKFLLVNELLEMEAILGMKRTFCGLLMSEELL